MIGTKFICHSGDDHEWFVFKKHNYLKDVWCGYPIKRYRKEKKMKEHFIQCYTEGFINQNQIPDMTLKNYQDLAVETAVYGSGEKIMYPTLGLANEVGEVLGKVKKVLRDNNGEFTEELSLAIGDEIGDVLWYAAALARDLNLSLEEIAERNIEKLRDRQARNVIHGSGDNR